MTARRSVGACVWVLVLAAVLFACSTSTARPDVAEADNVGFPGQARQEADEHCTVLYAADDQVALGGNNEDNYYAGLTHIWFIPPQEGRHGMALVGYDNFLNPEGAVNDQGLFYDALSVREVKIPVREGTVPYYGLPMMKIMTECATVDCALAFYQKYSMAGSWNGQVLIGDSQGNSAIIEPAAIVPKQGPFQVATNFFQSEVAPAFRSDTRYVEATGMLRNAEGFSVDLFRNTLDVVHQQYDGDPSNPPLHTQYSTIYDLRKGLIYLYYFHDFEHAVTFDLQQELAKGIHSYEIPSLFSPSATAQKIHGKYPARVTDVLPALHPAAVDLDLLQQYAGKYQIVGSEAYLDSNVYIKSEDGRLFIRNAWMPWVEGIPQPGGEFVYRYMDSVNNPHELTYSFVQDASGQVTTLELSQDDSPKVPAKRVSAEIKKEPQPARDPRPATPPDRTRIASLGVILVLALCLVGFGIKALRNRE